jgi:hypothetical protein
MNIAVVRMLERIQDLERDILALKNSEFLKSKLGKLECMRNSYSINIAVYERMTGRKYKKQ